jgi:hypothetical protein
VSETGRGMMAMGSAVAIWLIVTQWLASAVGGYLTGRLRTKWVSVHTHEVFFRDTAHGFLAWAAALLFGVALLSSTLAPMIGHMRHPAPPTAGEEKSEGGPMAYYVDTLYRPGSAAFLAQARPESAPTSTPEAVAVTGAEPAPTPMTAPSTTPSGAPSMQARISPELRAETSRILMMSLRQEGNQESGMASDDKAYLSQQVADHTGLSTGEAAKRVDGVIAKAKDDAAKMRKGVGYLGLFGGLAMLIGAFIASAAAAFGGSQRDEWEEAVRNGTYNG